MYPPGLFCSEHVAGDCLLPCSKCVSSNSAFPPACAICCFYLSVSVCGRKPAGTEDSLKHSEASLEQSDQNSGYRWTTGSRRFGTAPTTILVSKQVCRRQQREEITGLLLKNRAAVSKLQNLGPGLSQSVLCEDYCVVCVIAAPRHWKVSVEHCGRVGFGRLDHGSVQVTEST